MGKHGCAVNCCEPSKDHRRHRFPNPIKNANLFNKWLQRCANKKLLTVPSAIVYQTARVCQKHFKFEDFGRNNVLQKNTLPSLFLPELLEDEGLTSQIHRRLQILKEHSYCSLSSADDTVCESSFLPKQTESADLETSRENTDVEMVTAHTVVNIVEFDSGSSTANAKTQVHEGSVRCPLKRSKDGLLRSMSIARAADLTPNAKYIYKEACRYRRKAQIMHKKKLAFKERLKNASKMANNDKFSKIANGLNEQAFNFFKSQLECANKKPKGRRFSFQDKIMALALYKKSGTAYTLLSQLFALPSRVTLQKLLNRIPISAGVNEAVFSGLKSISRRMRSINRNCTLMFDEMSLTPHLDYNLHKDEVEGFEDYGIYKRNKIANHVQVYMLKGIGSNWKQPILYNFVQGAAKSADIAATIKKIIILTKDAGFNVIATVCDQGTNNVSAINSLVRETKQKYIKEGRECYDFIFEVGSATIVPLFDCPHLLKGIRNNLITKDIVYTLDGLQRTAKWSDIYTAWKIDSISPHLRSMPKLTEYHVNPFKVKKMKVSICSQVFSHTVASTINLMALNEWIGTDQSIRIEKRAVDTAEFLKFFDSLMDSVNGTSRFCKNGKILRTAVCTEKETEHVKFWRSAIPVLESMHCVNNGTKTVPPTLKNWQLTLKGFLLLHQKLKSLGFPFFKPRYFNQDPLENFFGQIRQRGQRFINPTCSAFGPFYKSLLVNNLVSRHSMGANCEGDNGDILLTLQEFFSQELLQVKKSQTIIPNALNPQLPTEFNLLKPLEMASLSYVAGYIIKVIGTIRNCVACKHNILSRIGENENFNCLVKAREYGGKNVMRLQYCNLEFVQNLVKVYNIIKFFVQKYSCEKNILKNILIVIKEHVDFNFISCEHSVTLLDTILNKFATLVLFNYFNGINKIMSGKDLRPLPSNSKLFQDARNIYLKNRRR